MKLLIADDDLLSRKMLMAVTKKWNYQSIMAEDGKQAWNILQQENAPLLLIIDWEMPYMNGIELCRAIRSVDTDNPAFIILLTGRNDVGDIVEGLEAGANDYIVKPFSNAELKARIGVGKRMLELQDTLLNTQNILHYERKVIENVLLKMRASQPLDNRYLKIIEMPVEKTSGDIILSAFKNEEVQHILLGDFTGHGLTAAIAGPVVFSSFYEMTEKNKPMAEIVVEINSRLVKQIPVGLFLGAIFIELNHKTYEVNLWNCGMSDILIYRKGHLIDKVSSNFLALGIIQDSIDCITRQNFQQGDRIYAYSDGITEIMNDEGIEFGQACLENILTKVLSAGNNINILEQQLNQFRGEAEQFDDMSLLEVII